ncbi:S-layer homology domain-containing protein [Paenibacillus oryzisoli]|uniref:S-layer homology domain-containing protein n=1 Tax=Paenibacillus oryzisoli TaxID=1850517 RepID=UPI003D2965B4
MRKRGNLFKQISLLVSIAVGVSGFSGVLPSSAAASDGPTVYLVQDFEDYTQTGTAPSGFELTGTTATMASSGALKDSSTAPNGTSVALQINESVADTPDAGIAKRFGTDDLTGNIIFDFDIKSLDANGNKMFEMKDSSNKGIDLGSLGADGALRAGGKRVDLDPLQWHRLSFVIDFQPSVQTVSVYVDGVKKIDAATLTNSSGATGINYLRVREKRVLPTALTVDSNGVKNFTTLLDNMRVYSGTELKTMQELKTINQPDPPVDVKTVVYSTQDFESYTQTGTPPYGFEMVGTSDTTKSSGPLNDSSTAPNGTSVALRINESVPNTPDAGLAKRFGTDDLTGNIIFDFEIKSLDANGMKFFEMKDSNNNSLDLGNLGADGALRVGGKRTDLDPTQWHRLSFMINFQPSVQTVSVYVDGVNKIDATLTNSSNAKGINYLRVRGKRNLPADLTNDVNGVKNFTTLLDNMSVYSGTTLKTMQELQELSIPDSLMDVDNHLGISVQDRLAGALAMEVDSTNVLMDNVKTVNAISKQNRPRKEGGIVLVPLRFVSQKFGITVQSDGQSASATVAGQAIVVTQDQAVIAGQVVPSPHIQFTSDDVLVPLDIAGAILHKQVYTDMKGRGLIVIGDQAKPFDDALDRLDGNVKPQDNEKFYIEEAIREIVYDRPTGDEVIAQLANNHAQHPRILATQSDFTRIKSTIASGEATMNRWYQDIQLQGEKNLQLALPKYEIPDGRRMVSSRQVGPLVINLGMLYHLSDDPVKKEQYKQRIWNEVYTVSQFPDWNEQNEFLNTAEFTEGLAIAYDWLYDAWTPEQRGILEDAMIQKGLVKTLEAYNNNVWWIHTYPRTNNWNAVCNGAAILTLMSIGDVNKEISLPSGEKVSMQQFGGKVLDVAFRSLENYILLEFVPDGAWAEGPSYWEYTLQYIVKYIAAMESALGTSYGYDQTPGLSKTGFFPGYLTGPVGSLNYGDASSGKIISPDELWLAKKYNDPIMASVHLDNKIKYKNAGSELEMLWYQPELYAPGQQLALDQYFSGTEVTTFRGSWEDANTSFLGVKAGNNVASHGHYDLGSFVFEALGRQWAIDIGKDDYNLPGYSDEEVGRLAYYRAIPEGHNTLVINPNGGPEQDIKAFAKIEKEESKPQGGFAIANLTDAYRTQVSQAKRGFMLASNRKRATIQDEVAFLNPSTAYWFMHTEADIQISADGKSAILSKAGQQLWVGLNADARDAANQPLDVKFDVMDAKPLPGSPNPPNQNQNAGIRKLFVKMDGVKNMRLTVTLIPIIGALADTDTTVAVTPLDQWSIPDGDLVVPVLQNVSIDGTLLTGFNSRTFSYEIPLPLNRTDVPVLTYNVDASLYDVTATAPAEVPGITQVIVSSRQHPEIKSMYQFNYKLVPQSGEEEGLMEVPISAVSASSSQAELGNTEDKAIDGNYNTYWAAEGDQWMMLDLGTVQTINSVGIAFLRGNERSFKYDIETSKDGQVWYKAFIGQSSGESLEIEKTYLKQHDARYVRITGHGNSVNAWNSYAEVRVYQLDQTNPNPASNNEDLVSLTASTEQGVLPLNVSVSQTEYTASVGASVSAVTVVAATYDSNATVHINGEAGGGKQIALVEGLNTITIGVTAPDGVTQRDYTLLISKATVVTVGSDPITLSDAPISLIVPSGAGNKVVQVTTATYGDTKQATLPLVEVKASTVLGDVTITIPDKTKITAPSNWNGTIKLPEVQASSTAFVAGGLVQSVIEVGSPDAALTFDKAVRVLIPNQAGKKAGYIRGDAVIPINRTLSADSQAAADSEIADGGDATIDVGTDLVIWTKHFTRFVSYTPVSSSGNSGSNSSGSSAPVAYHHPIQAATGGTVNDSGVTISIPAEAATSNFAILVTKVTDAASLLKDSAFQLIGDVFEIKKDKEGDFLKAVSITLPFDKAKLDAAKSKVSIYWYDEAHTKWVELDQPQVNMDQATVTGKVKHFAKFAVLATEEQPAPKPAAPDFKDTRGHWAESDIKALVKAGVIDGYPDGTFAPEKNMTRAEFATVIVKAFKLEMKSEGGFVDTANHWAKASIETAAAYGIVNGTSANSYGPDDLITREQMATMIVRAAKLSEEAGELSFTDQADISVWAQDTVAAAVANGLVSGYSDGSFKPQANATRAEVITVIVKAMKK